MTSNDVLALKYFKNKQYNNAFDEFLRLEHFYECGYCKFIIGDIESAGKYWKKSKVDSPALIWGLNLLCLINLTIPNELSFFQIRNFLERDMQLLFENNQLMTIEKILNSADILATFNPESYKFIGRVLLNNGHIDFAGDFLQKAKDMFYMDCEVHFLLAQYYLLQNNADEAILTLKNLLTINSEYFPASNLLKKLV